MALVDHLQDGWHQVQGIEGHHLNDVLHQLAVLVVVTEFGVEVDQIVHKVRLIFQGDVEPVLVLVFIH